MLRALAATAICFVVGGCRAATSPTHTPHATRPRLVVSIVLDQVGTTVLERYTPVLHAEGALRRGMATGAYHHRVTYAYAGTYTAPGHAAIYSGAPPGETGVVANRRWDPVRRHAVSMVDDAIHPVFGAADTFASPTVLAVETVGDVLHRTTAGRGRVVSLSLKDRGAVLPGGAHPDAAIWYDEHARGFTTSTWYEPALPQWVHAWSERDPVSAHFTPWTLLDGRAPLGRDDPGVGEGNWHGFGTTFPHDLARADDPYAAILASPQGTDLLLSLANAAVDHFELGRDDVPDLLAISVSGTDYVGHVFGAESWEAEDNLIRVDLALGRFLDALAARTPIAVLVTADHGVAPRPETSRAAGHAAERLENDAIVSALEHQVEQVVGPGHWIDAFVQPLVYFAADAERPEMRPRVAAATIEALAHTSGVHAAFDVRDAERLRADPDPLRHAVGLSADPRVPGDVFVVPARYSVVDEHMPAGFGTSHGTPWPYDTEVPVVVWGAGVEHVETHENLAQDRVAATLAALLGIDPPAHGLHDPLPGVRRATR